MRILALLILCLGAATAQALPTVEDVEHAVHRGDYSAAQSMTREVLAAKPDNAKAHYILAELLAHDGKLGEARAQAATAQQLDPAIHFTTPERFREFEAQLGGAARSRLPSTASRAVPSAAPERASESSSSGGVSMTWIVVLLGIGAIFLFMRRRPATPQGYGGSYPVPSNGMPGGPGYPGGTVYPNGMYPNGPPGSGIGGTVVAGLGGIAAGMVAEHLIEEALDNRHHGQIQDGLLSSSNAASESLEDRPIDFGNGSDWGGDSGSSADSGGGFDSGGGDWS
jgi:hypothetical protein